MSSTSPDENVPPKKSTRGRKRKEKPLEDNNTSSTTKAKKQRLKTDTDHENTEHKKVLINTKLKYGGAVIEQMRKCTKLISASEPNIEFEIRLGKIDNNNKNFKSGVSVDFFKEILEFVSSQAVDSNAPYQYLTEKDKWEESWTFYYPKQIRCHQLTNNNGVQHQFEQNGNISRQDFKSSVNDYYDIRFALKKEIPLTSEEAYQILETNQPKPLSVRLRKRRTFLVAKYGMKLDFTIAHLAKSETKLKPLSGTSNDTVTEVSPTHQNQGITTSYEIELEIDNKSTTHSKKIFELGVKMLGFGLESVLALDPV